MGAAADLDGATGKEIVAVRATSPWTTLDVLKLNNGGGFDVLATISLSAPFISGAVTLRDLNGDGLPDLILAGATSFILTQNPDHSFTERIATSGPPSSAEGQVQLAIGDVTGDARLDVVLPANGLSLLVQQPNGSFQVRAPYFARQGVFIDFNNDGRPDVLDPGNFITIAGPLQ